MIDDGGPVSPQHFHDANCVNFCCYGPSAGMSLRAYFAGDAMQAIIAHSPSPNNLGNDSMQWASTQLPDPVVTAQRAVEYADALIAALKESKP